MNSISNVNDELIQRAYEAAKAVREHAYAPYSKFKVGASIITDQGRLYAGCNVENVAFPSSQCAEASAIGNMVSGGGPQKIVCVVVVVDVNDGISPCGNCLQMINELAAEDVQIMFANLSGVCRTFRLSELSPYAKINDQLLNHNLVGPDEE